MGLLHQARWCIPLEPERPLSCALCPEVKAYWRGPNPELLALEYENQRLETEILQIQAARYYGDKGGPSRTYWIHRMIHFCLQYFIIGAWSGFRNQYHTNVVILPNCLLSWNRIKIPHLLTHQWGKSPGRREILCSWEHHLCGCVHAGSSCPPLAEVELQRDQLYRMVDIKAEMEALRREIRERSRGVARSCRQAPQPPPPSPLHPVFPTQQAPDPLVSTHAHTLILILLV